MRYTGDCMRAVSSTDMRAILEETEEDEQEKVAGKSKESVEDIGVPPLQQPSLAEDAAKAMTDGGRPVSIVGVQRGGALVIKSVF